jgi:hypothetical protein
MHPHVVVSGIASLFQKEEESGKSQKNGGNGKTHSENPGPPAPSAEGMSSEKTVNDEGIVNFVTSEDAYPRNGMGGSGGFSPTPTISSSHRLHDRVPSPSPSSHASGSGALSKTSKAQSDTSAGGSSILTSAMSFFTTHADDPFIRFLTKHSDAPVAAMSRWVVEYFEFGWAMFDYPELLNRYERLENWDGDWVCFWSVTGGEAMEQEAGMGDGERPPTPLKMRKQIKQSERLEGEFERAMRTATEKEERRRGKEVEKRAKQKEKERAGQEKAIRKREEEQEKQRKKEEETQERERKKAADLLEKEMKKDAVSKEKDRKAKGDAEGKEEARVEKEGANQEKKVVKLVKNEIHEDDESGRHSNESESSAIRSLSRNLGAVTDFTVVPNEPPPEVVIEGSDVGGDTRNEDNNSVTGSFWTALETHNPDSTAPSPARSLAASPTPSRSRPPSPGRASAHHFITLPGTLHPRKKNHWLKVRITGVEDEVAAHCGLFIRAQNLDYDRFVERVGNVVKSWVL